MTGDWEIFRLGLLPGNPDADDNLSKGYGRNVTDLAPTRSPDARWIAFVSNRDGNWEIYVAPVDGTLEEIRRITFNDRAIDLDPVWSPDGTKLVYESTVDGNWEIRYFDLLTGEKRRLTNHPANDINPFWSEDGTRILFQSDRYIDSAGQVLWQIYELDLNNLDAEPRRLSDGTSDDHDPMYSFDGTKIAFRSYRDDASGQKSTVYVMNYDGSELTRVSELGGDATNHTFSPDGTLIAYQSDINQGINDIYVYEIATGRTRLITENSGVTEGGVQYAAVPDVSPTWFCNSTTLVFATQMFDERDPGDAFDIVMTEALPIDAPAIKVDTEAIVMTTNRESHDWAPQNSPAEENASRVGIVPPKWNGQN